MIYLLVRNTIAVLFAVIVAGVLAGSNRVDATEGEARVTVRDQAR